MKEFVVKKSSWHYRLIEIMYADDEHKLNAVQDMCTYWKFLMGAFFRATMMLAFAFVILVLISTGGYMLLNAAGYSGSMMLIKSFFVGAAMIGCSFLVAFIIARIIYHIKKIKSKRGKVHQESIFAAKYSTLKEKYCRAIKIVE